MKYIRTKDEIYKSKRKCLEEDCLVIGEKENGQLGLIRKNIIKQANTIEELCDEFIEVDESDSYPYIVEHSCRFEKWNKYTKDLLKELYTNVYGAIWTDKGLIYVAKMNEKGELELL